MTAGQRASAQVVAVNAPASVDVSSMGATIPAVPCPAWYSPQVGDAVILDWIGSQPFVLTALASNAAVSYGSYVSGIAYGSPHTGRSTTNPPVGGGGATPFVVQHVAGFTQMGCEVSFAAPGGALRLGLYADNGAGYPGALVASPGAVSTASVGTFSVAFASPVTLHQGLYWMAYGVEGGGPGLRSVTNTVVGLSGMWSQAGATLFDGYWTATGFGGGFMPSKFPAGIGQQPNLPFLYMVAQ